MREIGKKIRLHILNASGQFDPWVKKIYKTSSKYLKIIEMRIPINNIDIIFYNAPWSIAEGIGVSGRSRGAYTIFVTFNLKNKNMNFVINKEMPKTLAHELHHIVRYREVGHRKTLLDALIAEGLAGHFVMELFGGKLQPWFNAVKGNDLDKIMKLYQKNYFEPNDEIKWLFGSKGEKVPKWAGYTVGYEIVKNYLKKHTKKKASNLYTVPSEEFVLNA